jgi:type III restriction enzyme
MKLHFEPDLDYQHQAIEAVCDLFRGQESCRTEFTVTRNLGQGLALPGMAEGDLGIGNRLRLLPEAVLANLHGVQLRNGVAPSKSLESMDFTVEMETGTGKTYVYLRTAFELNKRYGFTKFAIVVPSVAIKEGVHKSLEIMADHFRALYANVPFEFFLYDSGKLGKVRNFATSPHLQFMILTVGAINKFGDEEEANREEGDAERAKAKSKNVMYRHSEKVGDHRPIDLIRETKPILIVDEPQSVDGGLDGKGRQALAQMKPLCTLRYSATHVFKQNMVYRLDAVDAYERKLVKQIEVAAAVVEGAHARPYVKVLEIKNRQGRVQAQVELHVDEGRGVSTATRWVGDGTDLQLETSRAVYANCRIGEIQAKRGDKFMELRLPGAETFLREGESVGGVDAEDMKRHMIRRTIHEHLQKEKRLAPLGIKVLSLFFIDQVDRYRQYDAAGNPQKGDYAQIFEDEYARFMRHPEFASLFKEVDTTSGPAAVHEGYFAVDKRKLAGKMVEVVKDTNGGTASDEDAYSLIMRDKERLLSFGTPLKFIFSHSALREGWDNPNVFQICVLRDIGTELKRRQTIGRGLRLCVQQDGTRVRGHDVNTLTVISTESFRQFAKTLQQEIEEETGIHFGIVEKHQFAAVAVKDAAGADGLRPLGFDESKRLWEALQAQGYVNTAGRVQDSLREALKSGAVVVPEDFRPMLPQIREILRKVAGRLEVKNADERKMVPTRRAVLDSPEFKALWERIRHKTTYRVRFDVDRLRRESAEAIRDSLRVNRANLTWHTAGLEVGRAGVDAQEKRVSGQFVINEADAPLPDLLTELQDRTQLTRRTLFRIVQESGRLADYPVNPQGFIEQVAEAVNRAKRLALVDGIKYQRLGDTECYAQELFEQQELKGYLTNMVKADKSVHEYVVYDSDTESNFATELERNEQVKVYAKLPRWFTVPTPLGAYIPDWAVVIDRDGVDRLYFVVETKSSLFTDDLRDKESGKIKCGEAHFQALAVQENPARFVKATRLGDVFASLKPA